MLFDSVFRMGEGDNDTLSGERKALPTETILLMILVLSIGALFHAYCDALAFYMYTWCEPWSFPAIAWVLLRNRWYHSAEFLQWFQCDSNQYVMANASHISLNTCLNELPSLITTTEHIPNERTTSFINNCARWAAAMSVVADDTTNCEISHTEFIQ